MAEKQRHYRKKGPGRMPVNRGNPKVRMSSLERWKRFKAPREEETVEAIGEPNA